MFRLFNQGLTLLINLKVAINRMHWFCFHGVVNTMKKPASVHHSTTLQVGENVLRTVIFLCNWFVQKKTWFHILFFPKLCENNDLFLFCRTL